MIRINLLPHREARRKEFKSQFYAMSMLGALAGSAIVILVGLVFSAETSAQLERNTFIKQANEVLDKKIKDVANIKSEIDALKARQQAVEDLQADRNQPVYMMNELVKLAPEGLYLTLIKQDGQKIALKGIAQSHAVVGMFVNQLNSSPWMTRPEIIQNKAIELGAGRNLKRVIEFDLTVGMRRPRELEAAAASAALKSDKAKVVTETKNP